MKRWPGDSRAVVMLVLGLAVVATGRSLGNGFAFDDVPIVLENAQVHQLAPPWVYALQSYWPPKNLGDAYRPWTVWWLAIEWAAGAGAPWVFHLGNLLLTAAVSLLVLSLALEVLSPIGAATAAGLFAVHPVHVEATANVVGQGELWMTGFVLAAALIYLRGRRRGDLSLIERLSLAGLLVLASASKEQGIVLPGLLLLLELVVVPTFRSEPWRDRLRSLGGTLVLLAMVEVAFVAARFAVLGDLGGGPPAAGLEGLGLASRSLVMAPLVLDWVRLLVWPARLLAQYSPPAQGAGPVWNAAAVVGLLVVGAAVVAMVARVRKAPRMSLGLGWTALAILPVSNILFPTGVLVAERTLLLPSVGVVLLAGAALDWTSGRRLGTIAALGAALLIAAGAARSWPRQAVWHDNLTLFRQTVIDQPKSYRGFFVLGRELVRRNDPVGAEAAFAEAGRLYQRDHRVFEEWGQLERAAGRCETAVPIFRQGVGASPTETVVRSRLFECLYTLGRYQEALEVAEAGIGLGLTEFEAAVSRASKALSGLPEPPPATR